jgi:hypothetical protein
MKVKKDKPWIQMEIVKSKVPMGYDMPGGWGNGYIGLPKVHKMYEIDCDLIPTEEFQEKPHRGWTYSSHTHPVTGEKSDLWWLGFDTNHFGDNLQEESKSYVNKLTVALAKSYSSLKFKRDVLWEDI